MTKSLAVKLKTLVVCSSLTFLSAIPGSASAQIRASELGSVSQTVDGTTMTLEYSRPRMRARGVEGIFGHEVHWGEVWTPGANTGTKLTVNKDVTINGVAVPAGAYSMWMVVQDSNSWLTGLHPDTTLFHTAHPVISDAMIQFRSPVAKFGPTEDLTWSFSGLSSVGMTAEMAWADRKVSLDVKVAPSLPKEFASDKAAKFLGDYTVQWEEPAGGGPPDLDTTAKVFYRDGAMRLRWTPWFWPEMPEQVLIPLSDEWFTWGFEVDGEIYDVIREFTFEFNIQGGIVKGFDVRLPTDKVLLSGKKN